MRNRNFQPAPLNLPPTEITPVRIYGQLIGPMGRPEAYVKILLKAITTTQQIVQDTWSECTADQGGNYDFSVNPGKYAVFFERSGIKTRVNNIQVYSDSAPGDLQSFMLSPAPELLTPLVVQEVKSALELTSAAMLRARQWAENPVDVPVLDFEQGAGPEYSAYHWAHKAIEQMDTDTNINWRKEWDASTAYAFRDAVRYQGSAYYCTEANTGNAPPDIATADNQFWSLMASKGDQGVYTAPVTSVNTKTGDVVLNAADVGAVDKTGDSMTGGINMDSVPQESYDISSVSTGATGAENRLRIFRGGNSDVIVHERIAGPRYTISTGNDASQIEMEIDMSGSGILSARGEVVPGKYDNFDERYARGPDAAGFGGVGTYAFLSCNTTQSNGSVVAGGSLYSSGVGAQRSTAGWGDLSLIQQGSAMTGTWKCCGDQPAQSGEDVGATLYYRIA